MEEDDELALQSEVDILSQLDHPNVVKLYEIFDDHEFLYLVLEIMTGGEVSEKISVIFHSCSTELLKRNTTLRRKHQTQSNQS